MAQLYGIKRPDGWWVWHANPELTAIYGFTDRLPIGGQLMPNARNGQQRATCESFAVAPDPDFWKPERDGHHLKSSTPPRYPDYPNQAGGAHASESQQAAWDTRLGPRSHNLPFGVDPNKNE